MDLNPKTLLHCYLTFAIVFFVIAVSWMSLFIISRPFLFFSTFPRTIFVVIDVTIRPDGAKIEFYNRQLYEKLLIRDPRVSSVPFRWQGNPFEKISNGMTINLYSFGFEAAQTERLFAIATPWWAIAVGLLLISGGSVLKWKLLRKRLLRGFTVMDE